MQRDVTNVSESNMYTSSNLVSSVKALEGASRHKMVALMQSGRYIIGSRVSSLKKHL